MTLAQVTALAGAEAPRKAATADGTRSDLLGLVALQQARP